MGQSGLNIVVLGRIGAPFGVKGWLHIHSYTSNPSDILNYSVWYLKKEHEPETRWQAIKCLESRPHGKGFVIKFEGIHSREEAQMYTHCEMGVLKEELPVLEEGNYYWTDLINLRVITESGQELGRVTSLFETGSNDVLIIQNDEKEHFVPYIPGDTILKVDLPNQIIQVRWDPEF